MNLTRILQPGCIQVPLQAKDKEAVITELVDLLDSNGMLDDRDAALEAVFTREKTRSTGIGSGIAIPPGKCKGVKQLVMAIGVLPEPIDFASVDSKGVTIVILLVSPVLLSTSPDMRSGSLDQSPFEAMPTMETLDCCRHTRFQALV